MNAYSNEEYADMHFCYGRANGNALGAQRLYAEMYPNRAHPCHRTFQEIHTKQRSLIL